MPAPAPISPWLKDDATTLTIPSKAHPAGKRYRFESPDIDTGERLQAVLAIAVKAKAGAELTEADVDKIELNDDEEVELYLDLMGDTYEELRADGVSWVNLQRVGKHLFILFTQGEEAAIADVERAAGESRPPANRAGRRAAKKAAPKTATRTASRGSSSPRRSIKKA